MSFSFKKSICTANPTWSDIFESSKLKARMSLLPRFSEKRRSSFELWALKQHSKMSPVWGVGGKPKIVAKRNPSVSNSAFKAFFRWTWTSILLPKNWVSWISPNIWRDTVSKWTHGLMKEADNLERGLYCACLGCYPRLSGGGSELIKKVLLMKRFPWRMSTIEHW